MKERARVSLLTHYDDGLTTSIGTGHSGRVSAARISPDRKIIVSVGSEGGIFIWDMPPSSMTTANRGGGEFNADKLADDISRISVDDDRK